jgi:hypothetical protein
LATVPAGQQIAALSPTDVTRPNGQQTFRPPADAQTEVDLGQHFSPQQPNDLQHVVPQQ